MINENDYVDLLVRIVQGAVDAGKPYLTTAALGEQLRRAASDQSWRDFGYQTLSELLRGEKARARIEITTTDKGALAVRAKLGVPHAEAPPRKEYNRLKRPVWAGFVQTAPIGRRFLSRITGAVRSGLENPPVPYDEWAEITPIPDEEQKAWATQFLQDNAFPLLGPAREALNQLNWAHAFFLALGPKGPEWNKTKSSKVAAMVDTWASSKGISHDLVFQSRTKGTIDVALKSNSVASSADIERELILSALNTLTIDELRKVWLPAGVLLDAVRKA